jgi:hypothetical protein
MTFPPKAGVIAGALSKLRRTLPDGAYLGKSEASARIAASPAR